jgi:hypothetical protein
MAKDRPSGATKPDPAETAAPDGHFKLTLEDRMRAAMGPPAWALRLRRIEDLRAKLVATLVEAWVEIAPAHPGDRWAAVDALARLAATLDLATLNGLIDKHNDYYPAEGNLAMDPRTGDYLERGKRWTPLVAVTVDMLVEDALKRLAAAAR